MIDTYIYTLIELYIYIYIYIYVKEHFHLMSVASTTLVIRNKFAVK